MTVAPRLAASGARALEVSPPALNRAMSTPSKASGVASRDDVLGAADDRRSAPALRALEASSRSSPTGNARSWSIRIIVPPTTPVAPTTATVRGCVVTRAWLRCGLWSGRARREYSSDRLPDLRRPGTSTSRNRAQTARRPRTTRTDRPVPKGPTGRLGRYGSGRDRRPMSGPQTGSLARWRCIAALRDRLTRPWRSTSVTTTITSSPTDTTSSTVGTW